MKTKITAAALSALVLLSACDNSTNIGSDTPSASSEAPGNIPDTNTTKATKPPVIPANEAANIDQGIDQDAAGLDSDNAELPDTENEEFDNETGHNEEAYPDDQMIEEDAGGEVLPPTETDNTTTRSDTNER